MAPDTALPSHGSRISRSLLFALQQTIIVAFARPASGNRASRWSGLPRYFTEALVTFMNHDRGTLKSTTLLDVAHGLRSWNKIKYAASSTSF